VAVRDLPGRLLQHRGARGRRPQDRLRQRRFGSDRGHAARLEADRDAAHLGGRLPAAALEEATMRTKWFVGAAVAASLAGAASAHAAGPFDDTLVQAPTLKAPEWGSVVGSLAQLVAGPADLARGGFHLPGPFKAPEGRGPLLAPVFPAYSA